MEVMETDEGHEISCCILERDTKLGDTVSLSTGSSSHTATDYSYYDHVYLSLDEDVP